MAFSVNTNASALSALLNLNNTTRDLEKTQTNINTGLKISSAKDNAAIFSIAQKLRADLRGYNAVKQSLDRSISTTDIALAAAGSISDLLIEMKEKTVAASDSGLDATSRTALNEDFAALRDQISTIVANAEFNGTNLIDAGTDAVVAITNPNATQTISIAHQNLTLGGGNVDITATQTITTQADATVALAAITASLTKVSAVLTKLGAGGKSLESQRIFADKISDTIEVGIGNLVDANMAKESANLQSLQVKQQLGVQALSIANQAPQSILSLFGQ
ncbi:flagellin [Paremcibacter congregatus]|uniref:Flagellin n=1 Tax=Paremcibacter congregatus TaxID=2043170 RepID=A0A2G4YLZ4_9PROT|nr:flagellin [Paremcibacter congregatus]PHZ83332.1 flagellin [Paremcibacter congregatus]QDE28195.1 flagellin [Paremcibacter congregatus]